MRPHLNYVTHYDSHLILSLDDHRESYNPEIEAENVLGPENHSNLK